MRSRWYKSVVRTLRATRYVMPFKQGGSVPALIEGDDLGLYVTKLRGASQGEKALIAELIAGELARALGLRVPEIVGVELDASIAAAEPDPELCFPLERSVGLNLGLDFLPGSVTYDPLAGPAPDAVTASRVLLFDAFVSNVDRTVRNANLLVWHRAVWLIDHGASLYFHHRWTPDDPRAGSDDVFEEVRDHVLLPLARALPDAAAHLTRTLTDALIDALVNEIPGSWLAADRAFDDVAQHRDAYRTWLRARRGAIPALVTEAERARG
jgi:hypothetical protein